MLERFEKARDTLEGIVRAEGLRVADMRPWVMVFEEPYDNLAKMRQAWWNIEPFQISGLHSNRTIYREPSSNVLFRLWHDSLHVAHDMDFNLHDEMRLAMKHCLTVVRHTGEEDVLRLMWIDTAGQSLHCDKYGSFPDDQLAWAYDQFKEAV